MPVPCITVFLDEEQVEVMQPFVEKVREAAQRGEPGMLLGQILGDQMMVFFADQKQAAAFQAAMGTKVGLTTADCK